MNRIPMLTAMAILITLGTVSAQAATRQNDRKRDGNGDDCIILGKQTRKGSGNGGGDRKRDGSGSGERKRNDSGDGDRKRDGSGDGCTLQSCFQPQPN